MSYVRDVLTGRVPVDPDPNQRHPLDVLIQVWGQVAGRLELTSRSLDMFHGPNPQLRAAAVQFFSSTMAEDGGALLSAYEEHLADFDGVPRCWYPGDGDLRDLLVLAISKRMLPGSRALELIKGEALRPGHGGYATLGILATDPVRLRENLIEVINNSPGALSGLLFNLGLLDVMPDRLIVCK